MKITINDIARAAGVSKSTVSKVINDSPTISIQTKDKIRKLMKDMNYIPNHYATQLAKRSSNTIGFVINDTSATSFDPFYYSILAGCENYFYKSSYSLNIINMGALSNPESFMNQYIHNNKYSALILSMDMLSLPIIEELNEINFPYIVLGLYPEDDPIIRHFIDIDNQYAGKIVADFILSNKAEKVAYLGYDVANSFIAGERFFGFKNQCHYRQYPLDPELVKVNIQDINEADDIINTWLKDKRCDAIVCEDNFLAMKVLNNLRKHQLVIPDDIQLITFNDYPFAPYTSPTLTCVNIDTYKMGREAAKHIVSELNYQDGKNHFIKIKPEIIIRESTR